VKTADKIKANNFEKISRIHVMSGHPCPICKSDMMSDLILQDGRGVNSQNIQPSNVAGFGYFCFKCQRGWTVIEFGNELNLD
jgi:hypothetical protein